MARLLVQLKLRLIANALRASTGARVAFVLSTTLAALIAGGVCYVLASLPGGIAAADLTTVIFCLFALAWLVLPLMVFSLDSTLDPATLALYQVRTRPLAVGLLAASATGAWPAATLIALLGVTIGLARGALGVLIALLAVVLQVLFCITLARFVTTALAGVLRSRRGKDLAALLFIPLFAVYVGFFQIVPKLASEGALTASSFGGVDLWLRWTPPGLAVHAIFDASTGGLFRPGGRGQASAGRVRRHGVRPGRDRRGPGPGQRVHGRDGLPDGKARRHAHAPGGHRTQRPGGRVPAADPARRGGGGHAGDPGRGLHPVGPAGDTAAGPGGGRGRVRPGAACGPPPSSPSRSYPN